MGQSQSQPSEDSAQDVEEIARMQGEISSLQRDMQKMSKKSEKQMKILQKQQQEMMAAQRKFMEQMLNMSTTKPPKPASRQPALVIYEESEEPTTDSPSGLPAKDPSKSSEYQPSGVSNESEETPQPPPRRSRRKRAIARERSESVPSVVSSSERPIMMDPDEYHISDDFPKPLVKREKSTIKGKSTTKLILKIDSVELLLVRFAKIDKAFGDKITRSSGGYGFEENKKTTFIFGYIT